MNSFIKYAKKYGHKLLFRRTLVDLLAVVRGRPTVKLTPDEEKQFISQNFITVNNPYPDLTLGDVIALSGKKDYFVFVDKFESFGETKRVIIIRGNSKYDTDPRGQKFYDDLQRIVEGLGYVVSYDVGEEKTRPDTSAYAWIGYSKGSDRLQYAPEDVLTVPIGANLPGAINNPDDTAFHADSEVTDDHFIITPEMQEAIEDRLSTNPAGKIQIKCELLEPAEDINSKSLYTTATPISLSKGDIVNYTGDSPIETSVGRYLLNLYMLATPFGDIIEYVNDLWSIGKVEKQIAVGILNKQITGKQRRMYIDLGTMLGHSPELFVPTSSERSITTDPNIKKRKAELLEQYKDQLDDPLIIAKIEAELIEMDKEWLKDDPAMNYHKSVNEGKSFGVHRKKLLLTVGGIERFSDKAAEYDYVPNSLAEGLDKRSFVAVANEIRKGSHNRGTETAKGGAWTKFILRIFQDLKVVEDDCGTKHGVTRVLRHYHRGSFSGRHIIDKTGKYVTTISDDNFDKYLDKEVILRSPQYCKSDAGLCYKCCGEVIESLQLEALGVLAIEISSKFMLTSMKAMHGSSLKVKKIDFKDYFRSVK